MRVLDLGCGSGRDLAAWGITAVDHVTGLDVNDASLATAKARFPARGFLRAIGESLPFRDEIFDRVISSVALPYMNIPKALAEIHRSLVPGGMVSLSLHSPDFTRNELLHNAFPKPIPTLFRFYVMANGMWFHCTGSTFGFFRGRTESFQTERGIKIALRRAGFVDPSFRRAPDPVGETFLVDAMKLPQRHTIAAVRAA
jgi:ubiquinone/menaquinone biosynthesis C-methylase UbiE